MNKQTKVLFLSTFLFSGLILIFDLVVMLLSTSESMRPGSTVYLLAALGTAFALFYNYSAVRKLLEINKQDIADAIAAEEAEHSEEDGKAENAEADADETDADGGRDGE